MGRPMKRKLISPGRGFWSRSVIAGGFRRFLTSFRSYRTICGHHARACQSPLVPRGACSSTWIPAFAGMSGVSMRPLSRQGSRATTASAPLPQRLGETELVTVRVGQVKEPLAPFGVARRSVRAIAGRDHARMERVDVGMVEDDASPPGPRSLRRLSDQIEIAHSRPKALKRGVTAAVDHLKSQHAVEAHRARH